MMFRYALIMAAGKGTRLKPYTDKKPKASLNANGTPIISYSLIQLSGQVENIYVTIGHFAELTRKISLSFGANAFIHTRERENGWWMFNSILKNVNEPVLVIPCDIICFLDLKLLYQTYQEIGDPACMIVPVKPVACIEGDYIFGKNSLVQYLSRKDKSKMYSSGIQVLNPYKINKLIHDNCFDFNNIWSALIKKESLKYSHLYPHQWFSINTMSELELFNQQFSNETLSISKSKKDI